MVGLGGMGSAAAYHLARRGQRVLGLERFTPAHDRGSSHGGARIIRLAYFEGPEYVPLLLRAYELWRALADRAYVLETGRVVLSGEGGALAADPRVQAAYLGGDLELSSRGAGSPAVEA